MAKIEMDISEYEIMKENKRLLENSLEKERGLQEKIERLNKEKIEALESVKMKVVKVKKVHKSEHIYTQRDPNYIFSRIQDIMYPLYQAKENVSSDRTNVFAVHERYSQQHHSREVLKHIFDTCFEKHESHSTSDEEMTLVGLDEVKDEIRKDIQSKINEDIKRKLDDYDALSNRYSEAMRKIDEKDKALRDNSAAIESMANAISNNTEAIQTLESKVATTAKIISMVNASDAGFFAASGQLKAIKSLAKEVGDEKL